jgi:hypothetical protein
VKHGRTMAQLSERTSRWQDWAAPRLAARKRDLGTTVSVVIPARNEEATVGEVVTKGELLVFVDGGRVTELAGIVQPLAGEWAARRDLMESLPIPVGYGIELAVLLDTGAQHGLAAIAQVDLGSRGHKHQASHDLAVMAAELLLVAERRRVTPGQVPSPVHGLVPGAVAGHDGLEVADLVRLYQFARSDGEMHQTARAVPTHERPPARSVTGLR